MSNADQELKDRPEGTLAAEGEELLGEERPPLSLEVNVEEKSSCERHITVSVSRDDVDRYLAEKLDELMPEAAVPGFRPGKAPRKLVQNRFKRELRDQVKGALLLDAMSQVTEADGFSAISEPDFDFDAVDIPDEGPFTFEFDIEVRPDFDLPEWKGLKLERPTREISDEDIDQQLRLILEDDADLVPYEGAIEENDFAVVKITVRMDGKVLEKSEELTVAVRPTAVFPDTRVENFAEVMVGAKAGETRTTTATISADLEDEKLAGKEVELEFQVLDVKRLDSDSVADEDLQKFGNFESIDELREAVRGELERRLVYEQNQRVRDQISDLLTESADWSLPPDLLRRQANRELQRSLMEMRAAGIPENLIRSYENMMRQESTERTKKALKEHFILERIAEEHDIDASDADYEEEIALIATQQRDSARRVRAKLEKSGQMDALRNQIIERRVLDKIKEEAEFVDVPFDFSGDQTTAVDFYVSGSQADSNIPEAKYADDSPATPQKPAERD